MLKHYFLFSLLAISMAFYACQDNAGATGQTDASKDTEDMAQFVEDENFKT